MFKRLLKWLREKWSPKYLKAEFARKMAQLHHDASTGNLTEQATMTLRSMKGPVLKKQGEAR